MVYQLEEFGLPRMISKKIHLGHVINFYDKELNIHRVLELFNTIGMDAILKSVSLSEFVKYIFEYFYDGIKINE